MLFRSKQYDLWLRYGGQYQEYVLSERHIESHIGLGYFGIQVHSKDHQRWLLDIYSGIGRIKRNVSRTGHPKDGEIIERRIFAVEYPEGDKIALNLQFGLQLGYILVK